MCTPIHDSFRCLSDRRLPLTFTWNAREAAGAGINEERRTTPIVQEWVQILGRNRGWWDDGVRDGQPPAENAAGFMNFGNTCFFSSTLQCVMHSHIGAALAYGSGPLARKTRALHARYWSGESDRLTKEGRRMLNPKPLWEELKQSGIFGRYDDSNMEDSATMLLDLFCGWEEKQHPVLP